MQRFKYQLQKSSASQTHDNKAILIGAVVIVLLSYWIGDILIVTVFFCVSPSKMIAILSHIF